MNRIPGYRALDLALLLSNVELYGAASMQTCLALRHLKNLIFYTFNIEIVSVQTVQLLCYFSRFIFVPFFVFFLFGTFQKTFCQMITIMTQIKLYYTTSLFMSAFFSILLTAICLLYIASVLYCIK